MKRQSAYQRLKAENLKLRQDIADLLGRNGFVKQQEKTILYNIRFNQEDVIWFGTPTRNY